MLKILNNCFVRSRVRYLLYESKTVFTKSQCRSHSTQNSPSMNVHILPALEDNYMYVLLDTLTRSAVVVDPVEPSKVLNVIEKEKANLLAILTTHHHLDHCGGNDALLKMLGKELPVYGGDDRITCLNRKISHEEKFNLDRFNVKCLFTPCHTSGHMCYYIQNQTGDCDPICFTGDTLFVGGCGRFFEGSARNMYSSLNILRSLPGRTRVYCGHEYTVSNLKFANHVEPQNEAVGQKLSWAVDKRRKSEPTVPSFLSEELLYNPFMRVCEESVQRFAKESDPISVMQFLRKCKDTF